MPLEAPVTIARIPSRFIKSPWVARGSQTGGFPVTSLRASRPAPWDGGRPSGRFADREGGGRERRRCEIVAASAGRELLRPTWPPHIRPVRRPAFRSDRSTGRTRRAARGDSPTGSLRRRGRIRRHRTGRIAEGPGGKDIRFARGSRRSDLRRGEIVQVRGTPVIRRLRRDRPPCPRQRSPG